MFSILQDKAVKEFEQILIDSGYINGKDLTDEKTIRAATKPIFYRNITPAAAPTARIQKKDSKPNQASLFIYYELIQPNQYNADNKTDVISQEFRISLMYDNQYLWLGDNNNKFRPYLDDLIQNFENNEWSIEEITAERAFAALEGWNKYAFQKQYIAQKLF